MRNALVALALAAAAQGATTPLHKLTPVEQTARIQGDLEAVKTWRGGLLAIVAYADTRPDLFPSNKIAARLPSLEERETLREIWKRWLDYFLALDAVGHYHHDFPLLRSPRRADSYRVAYAGFLARYRFALAFIERAERNPAFDTLLDEPVPELGLPAGAFRRFKVHYLNVARAAEFAAFEATQKIMGGRTMPQIDVAIDEDRNAIWRAGAGKGEALTVKSALDVLRRAGFQAYFPVQAGVSEWMGDTKVMRRGQSLISAEQIRDMLPKLEPGDVLLVRREWYLSNIGLPGFWPHAAIYIGTPDERRRYFDDDIEPALRARHPAAYAESLKPQEHGHVTRVLEAISEGVSFTTLEHSADADSIVILRPRLAKRDKATALIRAFGYAGRPYDFNFDFLTDAALVCTELVYKSYEPTADMHGLEFPLVEVMGRKVTPANLIARQFDEQFATPRQQFDLVLFLDGFERARKAVEATVDTFRASWKRPKWHILTQH